MFENDLIADVLGNTRTIAVLGVSNKAYRDSYQVALYMKQQGYQLYLVNPQFELLWGEPVYARLADLPPVDLVNVFRRSEYLDGIVQESIQAQAKMLWTQLGVENDAAAQQARDAGLKVVQKRCLKVEHARWAFEQKDKY